MMAGDFRASAPRKSRLWTSRARASSSSGVRLAQASSSRFLATIRARMSGTVSIKILDFHPIRSTQFVDVPRPVVAQQAGERAIGQQASGGLAAGAIIGFVGSVADARHLR